MKSWNSFWRFLKFFGGIVEYKQIPIYSWPRRTSCTSCVFVGQRPRPFILPSFNLTGFLRSGLDPDPGPDLERSKPCYNWNFWVAIQKKPGNFHQSLIYLELHVVQNIFLRIRTNFYIETKDRSLTFFDIDLCSKQL